MQPLPSKNNNITFMIHLMYFIEERLGSIFKQPKPGAISKISDLEILTIILYDGLTERHQTLRGIYDYIKREYGGCFRLPAYQNFIARTNKLASHLTLLIKSLCTESELVLADSTPMSASHPVRANHYKVLDKRSVGFTKNLMGWFFGFKLHIAVDQFGNLVGFYISKGSHHDRRHAKRLISSKTKELVGDAHYGGQPLVNELKEQGIRVISNANKNLSAKDKLLLKLRSMVESVIGVLKRKYKIVSHYCRSKTGYMVHYLRSLLSYQMNRVMPYEAS